MIEESKYWPFPFKPEIEWNKFDKDFIEFMKFAYDCGYHPRTNHSHNVVEAENSSGRDAFWVFRGVRNGWEPWLNDTGRSVRLGPYYKLPLGESACVCVRPPFRDVGYFTVEWLCGRTLELILDEYDFVAASPSGIVRRRLSVESKSNETASWTVYRQDDPGNTFVVAMGLTRDQVDALVLEMEARGHKQMYWAEQMFR